MFERIKNKFEICNGDKKFEPDEVNNILLSDTANRILIYTLRDLLNDKSQGVKWFVDRDKKAEEEEFEELYLFYHLYEQKRSDPYKLYVVKNKEYLNDFENWSRKYENKKRFFADISNFSKEITFFDDNHLKNIKKQKEDLIRKQFKLSQTKL